MGYDTQVKDMSLLTLVFSEPIWASMLVLIGIYFDEPYNGLLLISFFCIFIYTFFLSKKINIVFAFFFLLNPLLVDLVMGQVRSAFAMALFLVAVMEKRRIFSLFLLIVSSLIHSAIFLILAIYILAKIFERMHGRLDYKLIGLFMILLGLIVAILLSRGREVILGAVGDRRAEYDDPTNSVLYVSYWMLLAITLMFTKPCKGLKNYWGDYISIVMLTIPFFMTLFSTNGVRFAALALPFVYYSIFRRATPIREVLIGSLFCYQIIQYIYWVKV